MPSLPLKKVLYLGTSPPCRSEEEKEIVHYPVIRLIPKSIKEEKVRFCLGRLPSFSHHLFTSKNSVEILWNLCERLSIDPTRSLQGKCVSIGDATSAALRKKGVNPLLQAEEATQEGMIVSLSCLLKDAYVFYPRSSLAREVLSSYLRERSVSHEILDLYDTVYQRPGPIPSLQEIEEIVFTSPSTVDGFFQIFDDIPSGMKLSFQGPITRAYFFKKRNPG